MRPLLMNLALALVWIALTGEMTFRSFLIGFVIGYVTISLQHEVVGHSSYYRKVKQFFVFLAVFLEELMRSSLRVAHDVLTPHSYSRPGIIALPLEARTDFEITLLSIIISLTPGTLSIDLSQDRRTLYVHAMFVEDPEEMRATLRKRYEKPLLDLMR